MVILVNFTKYLVAKDFLDDIKSQVKIQILEILKIKKKGCWSGSGPHGNFWTKSLTTFDFLSKPKNIAFSTLKLYF